MTPNPGSREALDQGCTCPVLDNWHGSDELGRIRGFVTVVGCPLHHLMDDGAPACEHEVRCMCGNFADNRNCALYLDQEVIKEEGETCVDAETIVCKECTSWADKQPHLTKTERPVIAG